MTTDGGSTDSPDEYISAEVADRVRNGDSQAAVATPALTALATVVGLLCGLVGAARDLGGGLLDLSASLAMSPVLGGIEQLLPGCLIVIPVWLGTVLVVVAHARNPEPVSVAGGARLLAGACQLAISRFADGY